MSWSSIKLPQFLWFGPSDASVDALRQWTEWVNEHLEQNNVPATIALNPPPQDTTEPVLIRIWDKNFHSLDYLLEPFDHGFTVPWNHPIAPTLTDRKFQSANLTVHTTDELHWKVRQVQWGGSQVRVECEPWIEGLRRSTFPDDQWLIKQFARNHEPQKAAV